jgi:hypothetical protein
VLPAGYTSTLADFFYNSFKRSASNEYQMANYLNHVITVLEKFLGRTAVRRWSAENNNQPVPGSSHPRKPDLATCNQTILDNNGGMVPGWGAVHSGASRLRLMTFAQPALDLICERRPFSLEVWSWMTVVVSAYLAVLFSLGY